jgi:hypothetical protein
MLGERNVPEGQTGDIEDEQDVINLNYLKIEKKIGG